VQSYTSPVLFKVEFVPVAVSFLFWSSTAQLGVILSYKQTTKTEKCTRNTTLRSTKASCLFRHLVATKLMCLSSNVRVSFKFVLNVFLWKKVIELLRLLGGCFLWLGLSSSFSLFPLALHSFFSAFLLNTRTSTWARVERLIVCVVDKRFEPSNDVKRTNGAVDGIACITCSCLT